MGKILTGLVVVLAVLAVAVVPAAWLLSILWNTIASSMFGDTAIQINWTTAACMLILIKLIQSWIELGVTIKYQDNNHWSKW